MASMELDIPRLATFASLPENALNDLLLSPTIDLVKSLLGNLIIRAREQDEAQSAKLKLKVELENAIRAGEAKAKVVKSSLDKNLEETSKLRQQLQSSGSSSPFHLHYLLTLLFRINTAVSRYRTTIAEIYNFECGL